MNEAEGEKAAIISKAEGEKAARLEVAVGMLLFLMNFMHNIKTIQILQANA